MSQTNDQVVVITGGNSGIGLATARAFVEDGARVALLGRDRETLDGAISEVGDSAIGIQGDVTHPEDLDRLVAAVSDQLGRIDVLFVNAGIAEVRPMEAVDEAHFDLIFGVNVKGAYFTVQKALPHLEDGASIVLNTSIANQLGNANFSVYTAAKAAFRSPARPLSAELVARGIRVNAISPGPIETPIYGRLGLPSEAINEMEAQFVSRVPLQRFGSPEEIASGVLFLASDASSFVLGHELVVDGGMSQL